MTVDITELGRYMTGAVLAVNGAKLPDRITFKV